MRRDAIITIIGVASCLGVTGVNLAPKLAVSNVTVSQSQIDITVSVQGEVRQPGTYVLAWGAVAEDAVIAAGGFTDKAEHSLVNLAQPLDAGETLFVPSQVSQTGFARISINSSSQSQLETLPRIGPKTAQRIIESRPYSRLDDLLKVKGIGPKTLEGLRDFVTL